MFDDSVDERLFWLTYEQHSSKDAREIILNAIRDGFGPDPDIGISYFSRYALHPSVLYKLKPKLFERT